MQKYVPCSSCVDGWIYSGESASKCSCLEAYQQNTLIELRMRKAGIEGFDKDFCSLFLDDKELVLKIKQYIDGLTTKFSNDSSLYFYGGNCSSKTYTAKIILREAIKRNISSKFILMNDLMNIICNPFAEGDEVKHIEFLENVKLLCIDDSFDPKKVVLYKNSKEYQMAFLDSFLRKRLESNKLNTIFTSNVAINNLGTAFTMDLVSLLKRKIQIRGGELSFPIYVLEEHKIDIGTLWT